MIKALRNHKQGGFTLIELMIVVAIIGILSAIAIPNYLSYRATGADAAARAEARSFYTTVLAEYADTGMAYIYPVDGLPVGFTPNDEVTIGGALAIGDGGVVNTAPLTFEHGSGSVLYYLHDNGLINTTAPPA